MPPVWPANSIDSGRSYETYQDKLSRFSGTSFQSSFGINRRNQKETRRLPPNRQQNYSLRKGPLPRKIQEALPNLRETRKTSFRDEATLQNIRKLPPNRQQNFSLRKGVLRRLLQDSTSGNAPGDRQFGNQ